VRTRMDRLPLNRGAAPSRTQVTARAVDSSGVQLRTPRLRKNGKRDTRGESSKKSVFGTGNVARPARAPQQNIARGPGFADFSSPAAAGDDEVIRLWDAVDGLSTRSIITILTACGTFCDSSQISSSGFNHISDAVVFRKVGVLRHAGCEYGALRSCGRSLSESGCR